VSLAAARLTPSSYSDVKTTGDEWKGNVMAGTGILLFPSARKPLLGPLYRVCIKGSFHELKFSGVNLTEHLRILSFETSCSILFATGREVNVFYAYVGTRGCCDFKSYSSILANLFHRQGLICDTKDRTKNKK
jgi:hypothetical protein